MNANRKFDQQHDYQVERYQEEIPKYQTYQGLNQQNNKLKELLFFAQIASFCIATIISCLVLLSLQLKPILAFPLGMMLSFGLLLGIKFYIHNHQKRS